MSYRFKVNIGDWSKDGHNQYEVFIVESTEPNEKVQESFKIAGTKIGIISGGNHPRFLIADDYEDSQLNNEHAQNLADAGVKFSDLVFNDGTDEEPNYIIEDPSYFVDLLMRIAQTELDFEYSIVNDEVPDFNGFWGDLNMSMGYGLFGC
jgi:hypothetical protein